MTARYIAFEGGEGAGKSTQARRLAERIGGVVTREPGGTALGLKLRQLLLGTQEAQVGARAETLLMAADRAQHVEEVVLPALRAGRHVVSDRTVYSSLAYQGGGRKLGVNEVRAINEFALQGRWPDAVILLDVPVAVARGRLDRTLDRLEQETEDFHVSVMATFDHLAATDVTTRWHRLDASGTVEQVADAAWAAVADLFPPAS